MAYIYKNITGNTAEELYSMTELRESRIKTISLANIHATDKVSVDLYLYTTKGYRTTGPYASGSYNAEHAVNSYNTYYMYKAVVIPIGATLQLESKDLYIDYNNVIYDLYIKLNAADSAVDVIINN
tara:strand:+ start:34 stop:411 length:378 start_codon:yes stop_codon:yes gene_type:complete